MLFVKLKVFLNKRSASRKPTRNPQTTPNPSLPEHNLSISQRVGAPPRPSSLVVLANTSRGEDAETLFPQLFMEEVSRNCIFEIERPLSVGHLKALAAGGIRMSELKSLLTTECMDLSSIETFDVVVPLRITNSQTSIAIEAPKETQVCLSETLCNNLIAFETTP
ncbi:hypothetical protein QCA50_015145 [Cerrena zonata]|uniref:Uncharacterized protein n=1 Tax=Cerrena zonata TaxID=2478898 RepID=A0AAW0FW31_9APHY